MFSQFEFSIHFGFFLFIWVHYRYFRRIVRIQKGLYNIQVQVLQVIFCILGQSMFISYCYQTLLLFLPYFEIAHKSLSLTSLVFLCNCLALGQKFLYYKIFTRWSKSFRLCLTITYILELRNVFRRPHCLDFRIDITSRSRIIILRLYCFGFVNYSCFWPHTILGRSFFIFLLVAILGWWRNINLLFW